MNCNDIEHLLLLAQSGELNEKEFKTLEEHVDTCDACQRFENDLDGITKLAQQSLPADAGPAIEPIEPKNFRQS